MLAASAAPVAILACCIASAYGNPTPDIQAARTQHVTWQAPPAASTSQVRARGQQPEFRHVPNPAQAMPTWPFYPTSFLNVGMGVGGAPGQSPYASGTRQLTASMGLPPYGMDCCPCLANEEDYRVYPVQPMFLETASKPTAASPQSAQAMGWPTFPSFLQQDTLLPGTYAGIVDPQNVQSRLAMATQGLPPYGMDCCPCLANEEDYRVYPPDL